MDTLVQLHVFLLYTTRSKHAQSKLSYGWGIRVDNQEGGGKFTYWDQGTEVFKLLRKDLKISKLV